jgi:hypothetical protein
MAIWKENLVMWALQVHFSYFYYVMPCSLVEVYRCFREPAAFINKTVKSTKITEAAKCEYMCQTSHCHIATFTVTALESYLLHVLF